LLLNNKDNYRPMLKTLEIITRIFDGQPEPGSAPVTGKYVDGMSGS